MTEPEVAVSDRLTHPNRLRIGAIIAASVAVVLGAAVTMGASPSPSETTGAGGSTAPDASSSPAASPDGHAWNDRFHGGFPDRGGFRGSGVFGAVTITRIDGSNVGLETEDGWTRTITVSGDTTITKDGNTIALADLRVGDQVRFRQTRNSDGSYTVTAIGVVVPTVAGTVTEVAPTSITIKDRDGLSRTITTTTATTYRLGNAAGARSDVIAGSRIVAAGSEGSDNSFTATSVTVIPPRILGSVTAVSESTITIQRPDGTTLAVKVGSDTEYHVPSVTDADLSDVTVGMRIFVVGRQNADGSVDAAEIHAGRDGPRFPGWKHGGPAPSATPEGSPDNG